MKPDLQGYAPENRDSTFQTFVLILQASFMKNLGFTVDNTLLAIILIGIGEIAGKVAVAICGDHVPFLQVQMFAVTSLIGALAAGFMIFANSLTDMIIISVGKLHRCNLLAIKTNLKIGGPPVGYLGNAPCGGPGQKQHSQKPQGFDILKASKRHYGSLCLN